MTVRESEVLRSGDNGVDGTEERVEQVKRLAKKPTKAEGNSSKDAKEGLFGPSETVVITPAKMKIVKLKVVGETPLVQCKFSTKARNQIVETQEGGSLSKKGRKRDPKNFKDCFNEARHISTQGWDGIHAGGFRNGMISACKLVGFHMTKAKLGVFVLADGISDEGTPLVRITKGEPRMNVSPVRNATGVVDMRARPMWDPGWEALVTIRFDADMFSVTDVVNLMTRVGLQCGICEGRPNSKDSAGCDWGLFRVETA